MRSNLSNSSFRDCRLDSPSFALTQKRSNCQGQCQCKKGMSHSLTASLYWKRRSDFPAKAAQTTEAVKKQSYEFQLHRTAEPYVVVSLLLFILIKASSNGFWYAGYHFPLKNRQKQGSKCAVLHTIGLARCSYLEQHDEPFTSVDNHSILILELRRLQDISFTLF